MGTPLFGKEILATLVENGYHVVGVVTQPDKLVGRKQVLTYSEVKNYALEHDLKVLQPVKIRREYQEVIDLKADLIVTCAYGQIIPDELLNSPALGCINVHASLLPKLRGGAPIQHAIIDGYDQTGVTIMEMASKMDAGDIISQVTVPIEPEDSYGSLHDKLIPAACQLLLETLPSVIEQNYQPIRQNEEEVTYGFNISKEDEHLDLSRGYNGVYDQIRGLSPEPCCYGIIQGKKVKFHQVHTSDITVDKEDGTMVIPAKGQLGICVQKHLIMIDQLQLEGKSVMSARDFCNGAGRNWDGEICQ